LKTRATVARESGAPLECIGNTLISRRVPLERIDDVFKLMGRDESIRSVVVY